MKTKLTQNLLAMLLGVALTTNLHAQLVPDGGTLTFTGSTNLPGNLTVGTNGGNTMLNILAPGTVTNANGIIGFYSSSANNQVRVENSGAVWQNSINLYIGYYGSGNRLVVTNGAVVANANDGIVGSTSSNNLAVVTGTGSLWTNGAYLFVGYSGSGNRLVVTNGAVVANANNGTVGSTSSNNLAVVTGTGSLWTNGAYLTVGYSGSGNQLMVSDGGMVANASDGIVGWTSSSSNNLAVVTGPGSLWTNGAYLFVGYYGSGNQMVVSNGGVVVAASELRIGDDAGVTNNQLTVIAGGKVRSSNGLLGSYAAGANDNRAVVSGPGSLWTNSIKLFVGEFGSGNRLVVTNGGVVANAIDGILGYDSSSSNNLTVVTGTGSLWTSSAGLYVGNDGSGNQLLVSNEGTVQTANAYAGYDASSTNNRVTVDGGNLIVTNYGGTGTLDIRRGTNVFNDGFIQADRLLLTNSAGFFEFNGGTFITGGGTVANGQPFVVGASGTKNAYLDVVSNAPLTLNNGFILGANTAVDGNQLLLYSGGVVSSSGNAFIGLTASNNLVVVDETGSSWTIGGNLVLGDNSAGNRLAVAGGGVLADAAGVLGSSSTANNNLALVRDAGSLWNNSSSLHVGFNGSGNQLVVSNGAVVANVNGNLGYNSSSSNNLAVVTGAGSLWTNSAGLYVGYNGSGNQLVASDGGTVEAANAYLGLASTSANNRTMVDGGNLIVTNSGGTAVLDVRRGTNVFNAGLIQADNLSLNSSAGFFEFNGGTLITGGGTVNNGQPFVVGASGTTAAILDLGNSAPLTLNDGFNLGANTAAGNQLLLTNGGTLNVTGESSVGLNASSTNNLAVVSGTNSRWSTTGYLWFGYFGTGNQLTVSDGGTVISGDGYVGYGSTANNNLAVVTGAGSLWANSVSLFVGFSGSGNQLIVSNGGVVANAIDGIFGLNPGANSNVAVVTGTGSLLTNSANLYVGDSGSGNQLMVSDGGMVANAYGTLGNSSTASNNVTVVTGAGSLWANSANLFVGYSGGANQLDVTDGGTVQATSASVGVNSSSTNNRVTVDGGNLIVTNSGGTGTLDIRRGTNVLNAGLIRTDNLLLNNSAGFFEFNGGTLIAGGGTVNNGQPFVVGASGNTAAILDVRSIAPLVVNNDFNLGANTAAGNQLLLTNGGILSVAGTSYVGAEATAANNHVTISGPNSLWTNSSDFYFGYVGSGKNQLVVGDGGALADGFAYIGLASSSDNNVAVVTGAGSTWTSTGDLRVGGFGSGNQLVLSNGAVVVSGTGYFAANSSESSNNLAMVTGPNSRWILNSDLNLGYLGGGNQLVVSDGGTVQATSAYVGVNSSSTNNRVTVDGGNLIVTNSGGTGTLDIRRGTNVLNAGLIQTDNLLLNTSDGFFEFNGGTLITSGSTVDNGQPFVVGNGSLPATLNLNGNSLHTFNNGLVISSAGTLTGNGTVAGPLTVQSGGNLAPGASVGLLVLNNSPVLQGSVLMQIGKTGTTLTNDQIQVMAALTYGGNLVVSNLGPDALAIGNSFQLFSATSYGGAFTGMSLPSPGPSLMWTNQLLVNGSIAVVAQTSPVISGLVKSGTNLVFNVSGGSPGGAYDVLTSTNVALPLSIWTTNSTGNFDWMGNATITNGIDPAEPQRFFTISEP